MWYGLYLFCVPVGLTITIIVPYNLPDLPLAPRVNSDFSNTSTLMNALYRAQ